MRARVARGPAIVVLAAGLSMAGCSSQPPASTEDQPEAATPAAGSSAAAPTTGAKVQRSAAAAAKAQSPAPPADAKTSTVIGAMEGSVGTANSDQDSDSFWAEDIDFDGDGEPDAAELLWDDEDKVLYLADDGPFTCINGQKGDGTMVMAIFADGNSRSKPPGSGWWLTGLDAGECGVKDAGLYGCRFGGDGLATECGSITLDETTDDVVVNTIQ